MQAQGNTVNGKPCRPSCHGDMLAWNNTTACEQCPFFGSCKWCIDQGIPHKRNRWRSQSNEPPGELDKRSKITFSDMAYILHELFRTTAEEFEAIVEAARSGNTAGNEAAEAIKKAIGNNGAVFFPLLDEIVARKYRVSHVWAQGEKRRWAYEAKVYLEACERLNIRPGTPEQTERMKAKRRGSVSTAAILDVLELDNAEAAVMANLEALQKQGGYAHIEDLLKRTQGTHAHSGKHTHKKGEV